MTSFKNKFHCKQYVTVRLSPVQWSGGIVWTHSWDERQLIALCRCGVMTSHDSFAIHASDWSIPHQDGRWQTRKILVTNFYVKRHSTD